MGSNAVSVVTASRTPRDTRRGTGNLRGDTFNIIKVRASFSIVCARLMGANVVALRGLVRLVSMGPQHHFRVHSDNFAI